MIDQDSIAINQRKSRDEMLEKVQKLIGEYRKEISEVDIAGVLEYAKAQCLAFHFMVAFRETEMEMNKLKQKGQA